MERSSKMDLFQKLGYDREDVVRVLDKLGQDALVNDVLQELIQTGSRPGVPEASGVPVLVPRGSSATLDSVPRWLGTDLREDCGDPTSSLRPIVIDGSNVAMSHGNKEVFSCRGIQLAVNWFRDRGHPYIKVFVPSWRKDPPRSDTPIRDQHVLEELERQAVLVYTPSRKLNGRRVVCYDDRYIVKVAYEQDGVIVSNDNYRDLQSENPEWKRFIEQRLLMFSFVNDRFMPPDDPLGRWGPTLSNFLSRKPKPPEPSWQHCPYGRKCTYGVKCRFFHPERPQAAQLAVADELRAQTRAWRGAEDERCRRPGPRDPAALEGGLSRLALRDDPAPGRGPARRPDRGAPSPPPPPGPPHTPARGSRGAVGAGDAPSHARPPRAVPADPWAPPEGAGRFSLWTEPGWGEGPSRGPPEPAPRTLPRRLLPPPQADPDGAGLGFLGQRLQGAGARWAKP